MNQNEFFPNTPYSNSNYRNVMLTSYIKSFRSIGKPGASVRLCQQVSKGSVGHKRMLASGKDIQNNFFSILLTQTLTQNVTLAQTVARSYSCLIASTGFFRVTSTTLIIIVIAAIKPIISRPNRYSDTPTLILKANSDSQSSVDL